MLPKTPQSYRIPEPIRSEIKALMADLDLVFVRKSFCPLPPRIVADLTSSRRKALLDMRKPIKSDTRCRDFMNRNHHRKDFRNVYPSDNNYQNLSLDWD